MAGYFMRQHIERVEREEGRGFIAVLLSLAKDGESKSSAAEILDIPQTTLCHWLRKSDSVYVKAIPWPAKGKSNGFRSNVETRTPARLQASLRNIKKTRTHSSGNNLCPCC